MGQTTSGTGYRWETGLFSRIEVVFKDTRPKKAAHNSLTSFIDSDAVVTEPCYKLQMLPVIPVQSCMYTTMFRGGLIHFYGEAVLLAYLYVSIFTSPSYILLFAGVSSAIVSPLGKYLLT